MVKQRRFTGMPQPGPSGTALTMCPHSAIGVALSAIFATLAALGADLHGVPVEERCTCCGGGCQQEVWDRHACGRRGCCFVEAHVASGT